MPAERSDEQDAMLRKHALIVSRAARANIIIESMKAANVERADKGFAQAYDEMAFYSVVAECRLGENEVLEVLDA